MRGRCLCGGVEFTIERAVGPFELCHCPRCRKASGSAFVAGLGVRVRDFRLLSGAELIHTYEGPIREGPPPYRVSFCSRCGSPVPNPPPDATWFEIPAGLLDDDPEFRPDKHIFVECKSRWFSISDSLPQLTREELAKVRHSLALEPMDRRHKDELCDMAEEFRSEGDRRFDAVLDDPEEFFRIAERFESGLDLPADRVQQSNFLAFSGDRLVGSGRVRHRLIPVLHQDGGHIGYEVRRTERGRGYGNALLSLLLDEARRLGLVRVLLTAATNNPPSLRTIKRNGGVADGTSVSPRTGEVMARFWISLT